MPSRFVCTFNKGHFFALEFFKFCPKPCWYCGEERGLPKKSKVRTSIESYLMFKVQNNGIRIAKLQVSLTRSYPKCQPFQIDQSSNLYRLTFGGFAYTPVNWIIVLLLRYRLKIGSSQNGVIWFYRTHFCETPFFKQEGKRKKDGAILYRQSERTP